MRDGLYASIYGSLIIGIKWALFSILQSITLCDVAVSTITVIFWLMMIVIGSVLLRYDAYRF